MKRLALLCALAFAAPAMAARTSEVLVLTTKTTMPALNNRSGLEIFNYGPNALHCSFGTEISGNAFWVINALSGTTPGYWSSAAKYYQTIVCEAVTSAQVSGAATIVNELD
jgi:hypothetical protein